MVTDVYRATQTFPKDETYGLSSQLRRSLIEMETQVVIGANLGYVSQDTLGRLMTVSGEVSRLHGLMQSIQPPESH